MLSKKRRIRVSPELFRESISTGLNALSVVTNLHSSYQSKKLQKIMRQQDAANEIMERADRYGRIAGGLLKAVSLLKSQ